MAEKKRKDDALRDAAIGVSAQNIVDKFGSASAEYIKGYQGTVDQTGNIVSKGLNHIAESKVNPNFEYQNLKQQAGFSAEVHFVNKENAENIIRDKAVRYSRSNDVGLGNDQRIDVLAVDIEGNPITNSGQPLWSAQMKFCGRYETPEEIKQSSENLAKTLAGDKWAKYRGNRVLIPSEQYEHVKKYAIDEAQKLHDKAVEFRQQGNLEKAELLEQNAKKFEQVAEDVQNSGISSKEAMFLREHAKLATAKYVTETAHRAGIEQAKTGAIISAAISVSQNIISVIRNEKEIKEALKDTAIDVAKGVGTSYIIGAGGAAIKAILQTSGNSVFQNLSRTNMPAMMATVSLQVGKSIVSYAKGEIDETELVEELGDKGTGMIAASWGAAIGTTIFPGVGTVIGGMIGYMTSSTIYKSAIQVLHEERVSIDRRNKIHALTNAALVAMHTQRRELSKLIDDHYKNRQVLFEQSFMMLEKSTESNDLDSFTVALNNIALEMGKALEFRDFDEFDAFMCNKNMVLEF
ncbi:hypothetical protein SOV_52340 [Sporomusa ovata DSM 2662]|uniref:Uncharacterized protein n=1 Tax=Sporomusa ovata TaxID=2378 RepID=A0A0U1KS25_9FIRM|nr:hypothetical protein [Sporomusa ovata]EQB27606.1 hypothetical protein SOV_2c05030 [Sporomusa ovata DSM 2662]CQR69959.1 hypothetical protein SpAn4DRAFT_4824 [Sporomusa ovata]